MGVQRETGVCRRTSSKQRFQNWSKVPLMSNSKRHSTPLTRTEVDRSFSTSFADTSSHQSNQIRGSYLNHDQDRRLKLQVLVLLVLQNLAQNIHLKHKVAQKAG